MKKLLFLFALCFTYISYAQNGINYKAVIKDDLGNVVANDLIVVEFAILDGATMVYQESHTPTTDDNGIIIVNIGEGTPLFLTFSAIDWSSNNHFLNVQLNTGGGLQDMGTTAFKTVPYALMAKSIENPLWTTSGSDISYNTGNVGIGTTSPSAPLEILGAGTTIPRFTSTGGTSGLALYRPGTTNTDWSLLRSTTNELQIASSADDLASSILRTRFKNNGDIVMAETEGRVGIGLSNPVNPFSVLQASGTANTVRIESQSHPTGKDLLELIVPSGSTSGSQFIEMQNGFDIVAAINSDGSAMFSSKLGIDGTPTGKLHIFQNGQTLGSGLRFDDGTANQDWDITHQFGLVFHYGGVQKGLISATTGAYIQGSDKTLKDDIQGLYPVLSQIDKLQPSTYVYKDDTSKTQTLGFIAQDVQKIFPEVVHYSEVEKLYGIDYGAFGVIAIKAIQEQQTIIENQQKQIDELKVLVQSLLEKQ